MAASTNKSLELNVQPLSEAKFGVKINGLNPSRISEEQKILIWDVYRENHGLICFEFDRLLDAGELYSLTAVFGENGKHTRAAISANSLPFGAAVEVEAIFEIK